MRTRLIKKLKDLLVQSKKPRWGGKKPSVPPEPPQGGPDKVWESQELQGLEVFKDLQANLALVRELFGYNTDFMVREFKVGQQKTPAALAYLLPLVKETKLDAYVLRSLIVEYPAETPVSLTSVKERAITLATVKDVSNFWEVTLNILDGNAVLFLSGGAGALALDISEYKGREIAESLTEAVVRGPRESFVESIERNAMLIRRRIRTPNLVLERFHLGRLTQTAVVLGYIKGLAKPELLEEVRKRLKRIDVDAVLSSNFIEEMIMDSPLSPFPQTLATDRPDRVAASLVEGRVVLLVDNTPFALVVPATMPMLLQSSEDYYHPFMISTVVRWLRYLALVTSIIISPLYVAITTFHQEMLPFELLLNIAGAREGVPFPAVIEALLLEGTFELLREAGIRLPRPVGQAVSIVGALVIGQSAVAAGIVSPLMVIVVAFAGISSFATPSYELAIPMRMLRFPLILLAGSLGLFGVTVGVLAIIIHLAGLRSFGVPYLSPLTPLKLTELKDVLVRAPMWAMGTRPGASKRDWYRQAAGLKPSPPPEES